MKKNLIIAVLIVAGGAVLFFKNSGNKPRSQNSQILTIGVSLPLTGSIAHLGESAQRGVELAHEEFTREHSNLNLSYYIEDNAFTGKGAVSAYRQLKDAEHINAIITATSPAALATQPMAAQDSILQMTIFASTPKYSSPSDLSFRIFPPSEKEAEAIAEYLVRANLLNAALIYINNDFGQGVANAMNEQVSSGNFGFKIISQESYLPDTTDFKTLLAKIRQSNPQAVVMVATAQDAVSIMRQAQGFDADMIFLATSSASDPEVLSAAAETGGLLVTDIFDSQSSEVNIQAFITGFQRKFGVAPDLWSAQGYDSYKLTALALAKCGRDGECLKSYLFGLQGYVSLLGNLTFDNNGDPDLKYFMKVFRDGKFHKIE